MPAAPSHSFSHRCMLAAALAISLAGVAHAQVRVVNWNIARLQGDPVAVREVIAALAEDDLPGFAAAPHVIVFQEVPSTIVGALSALVDDAVPGIEYELATYTSSAGENQSGGAMALFYRSDAIVELPEGHRDIPTGGGRNTDRWLLRPLGYTSPQAHFYVYGSHLKASTGGANEAERLAGALAIRADADGLPSGSHIIFSGDFNLYSHLEPAYAAFLAPGPAQALDPLGTGSWNGPTNAVKHTQSPRDITAGGLVGGGLDDRFDFQLSTAALQDNAGLSLVPGSTRAVGNDGLHYNMAINAGNNVYFPGEILRSNALADLLFDASDHLPVVCDYRLPAVMNVALAKDFGRVIQGAPFAINAIVQNIAAGAPAAIDPLAYVLAGQGDLSASASGTAPLAPALALVPITIDTASVGLASGSIVVEALSQAAENAFVVLPSSGVIVRPSNASFSEMVDLNAITIGTEALVGADEIPIPVPIWNFGFDAEQAALDVDNVLSLGAGFSLGGALPVGIEAEGALIPFLFDATGRDAGIYSRAVSVLVSDENIPGATAKLLPLTLIVTLLEANRPADLNGDGSVDAADLAILLGQWGTAASADLNGDGVVGAADLAILLGAWN